MKKIVLLLATVVAVIASSCTDKNAYTITGTAPQMVEETPVYLQKLNDDMKGYTPIDTAIIKDGKFTFQGIAEGEPVVRFVTFANMPADQGILFILEPGKIEINYDTIPSVKGTALNNSYQEYMTKSNELSKNMQALQQKAQQAYMDGTLTPEQEGSFTKEFEGYMDELSKLTFDFTKSNMQNAVGENFFMFGMNAFKEEQIKELLALARPEFKQTERMQKLVKAYEAKEKAAIGNQFIDIKGQTPDGQEIALSDYAGKGKIVLVDFWASWCGPCLQEMPSIVEAYKKYKDKNFEIVGVSLDESNEDWVKAIERFNITWPQMSDLKAWSSELSGTYGVTSIPYTLLLDKDGKIIEKNLRGEELLSKIDELLK